MGSWHWKGIAIKETFRGLRFAFKSTSMTVAMAMASYGIGAGVARRMAGIAMNSLWMRREQRCSRKRRFCRGKISCCFSNPFHRTDNCTFYACIVVTLIRGGANNIIHMSFCVCVRVQLQPLRWMQWGKNWTSCNHIPIKSNRHPTTDVYHIEMTHASQRNTYCTHRRTFIHTRTQIWLITNTIWNVTKQN